MKIRFLPALAAAFLVAGGLFWLMNKLITNEHKELKDTDDLRMIDFVRVQKEEAVKERKRELPRKPPPPKRPPPPPEMKISQTAVKPQTPQIKVDVPDVKVGMDPMLGAIGAVGGAGAVQDTGQAIPKAKFPPNFPPEALRGGIEGWVEVEFTVTPQGTVEDVKVVRSKPRKIFNREAKRTISKWVFRPAMKDGKPVESRQRQVIEFKF